MSGGGEQLRDFTYVDDAVDAFLIAATHDAAPGRVFNLGGVEAVSLKKLAETLTKVAPGSVFQVRDFPPERKKIDIGDYYSDGRLIKQSLGWAPRTDMQTALRKTCAYYRKELPHYL